MKESTENSGFMVDVITNAIKIPGVKVDREMFLRETFRNKSKEDVEMIVEVGPVKAGCSKEELKKIAYRFINKKTMFSTTLSFLAGLPGGFVMIATIPADFAQFYAVALKLAQELAYLYGEEDLWEGGEPDSKKVTNRLILYCGVMLGATGASQLVRVMTSALAKEAMKRLPQKALTKTVIFSITKSIMKVFGVRVFKSTFAKAVSKIIPIIGGVISGAITLFSIRPMAVRLLNALDEAHFEYSEEDFKKDWNEIIDVYADVVEKDTGESGDEEETDDEKEFVSITEEIKKAKEMLDNNIISEEEFTKIKEKLISKI